MRGKMRKVVGFCLIGLAVLFGVAAALALAGRLVYPYSFAPAVFGGLIVTGMLLRLWLKAGSVKGRVLCGVGGCRTADFDAMEREMTAAAHHKITHTPRPSRGVSLPAEKEWRSSRRLRSVGWVIVLAALLGVTNLMHTLSSGPKGQEYQAPDGVRTVIVEYSFMGAPKVYLKRNWLLRSPVAVEAGPGLMESVAYEVRWEAEDMLVLDLGVYKGALEWYAIDLAEMQGVWNRVLVDTAE